jgi:hypothetical protein
MALMGHNVGVRKTVCFVFFLCLADVRFSLAFMDKKRSPLDGELMPPRPELITVCSARLCDKLIEEILNVFPYQLHDDQRRAPPAV